MSCLTLCDPMNCSSPGSSVHGDSPGKNTGVGCCALPPVDLPTQGWNPGLPHCRQILSLPSEPPGKPRNTGGGGLSLLQEIFLTEESNQCLLHCRWILYQLSYLGSPHIHTYIDIYIHMYIYVYTDFYFFGKTWILARAECRTKGYLIFPPIVNQAKNFIFP